MKNLPHHIQKGEKNILRDDFSAQLCEKYPPVAISWRVR